MTKGNKQPSAGQSGRRVPFDLLLAAVMMMAFVSVWRIQDLYPIVGKLKLQFLAPGLGLLAFLIDNDPRRAARQVMSPLMYRILGVAAMVALSVPTSLWPGKSVDFLFDDHAKTLLLMFLVAASIRSPRDLSRFAVMHILGAVMYSYNILTRFRVSARSGRLGDLIYYDSNDLALLLVCTIPLCAYFLRPGAKIYHRLAASAVLVLLVFTLVQTGSRGGFLGFIACGSYLLFSFRAISKTARVYAVGTLVAFIMIFGGDRYWEMMSSMLSPKQDYNWTADSGRKKVWTRGVGYMLSHPITGVGARAFQQAEGTISGISVRQQYGIGLKWSAAHNSFVEVGAELGVIGLSLFLLSLLHAWRYVRSAGAAAVAERAGSLGPMGHAIGGTLIAYCVAGFFVSAGYSAYLYTIFGMVLGMMKVLPPDRSGRVAALATGSGPVPAAIPPRPAATKQPAGGRRRRQAVHPGPALLPRQPDVR